MADVLDSIFATIDAMRQDPALIEGRHSTPELLAQKYVGIDLLARKLLLAASRHIWKVPNEDYKRVKKDQHMGPIIALAEQWAPVSVSRPLLARVKTVYHGIRNDVEHHGFQVEGKDVIEYLEAIESLTHAISTPTLPNPPVDPLEGLEGYELNGSYELSRGQGSHPWLVVHASRPSTEPYFPGANHVLIFWRYEIGEWRRKHLHQLGQQYVATVQKIGTRSMIEEELLVWSRAGESMGVMRYDVLAVTGETILRLLGKGGAGAYVLVRGRIIEEVAGGRIIQYEWDGSSYLGRLVSRYSPAPIDCLDIHYAVSATGKVEGPAMVECTVGQVLRLVRWDFQDVVVRMLVSGMEVVELLGDGTARAVGEGESHFDLIPHVYDWQNALKIQVIVREGSAGTGVSEASSLS